MKIGVALIGLAVMSIPLFADAYVLTRQLQVGSSGADVSAVQTFLSADVTLYPERLVTGYYGSLTEAAVKRFQVRNGISAVGRIGPVTLPVINAQMNGGSTGVDRSAAIIHSLSVNPGDASVAINWNTTENTSAIVYYSTNPITMVEAGPNMGVNIFGSTFLVHTDLRTSHSASITGLQSDTTYNYVVYVRDGSGNESITWPSTFRTDD